PGLVMGGREHCNPDYAILRREFPFHGVEFVVSGRGSVQLDAHRYELGPGSVFTYTPEMRCEIHTTPADPMVKYFVSVSGAESAARFRRGGLAPGRARHLASPAEITSVLEDLVREGQRSGDRDFRR